jgi:hypothetical protein
MANVALPDGGATQPGAQLALPTVIATNEGVGAAAVEPPG